MDSFTFIHSLGKYFLNITCVLFRGPDAGENLVVRAYMVSARRQLVTYFILCCLPDTGHIAGLAPVHTGLAVMMLITGTSCNSTSVSATDPSTAAHKDSVVQAQSLKPGPQNNRHQNRWSMSLKCRFQTEIAGNEAWESAL